MMVGSAFLTSNIYQFSLGIFKIFSTSCFERIILLWYGAWKIILLSNCMPVPSKSLFCILHASRSFLASNTCSPTSLKSSLQLPPPSENVWHLSYRAQLTSVNATSSRLIYVAPNGKILYFFNGQTYAIVYISILSLSIHPWEGV